MQQLEWVIKGAFRSTKNSENFETGTNSRDISRDSFQNIHCRNCWISEKRTISIENSWNPRGKSNGTEPLRNFRKFRYTLVYLARLFRKMLSFVTENSEIHATIIRLSKARGKLVTKFWHGQRTPFPLVTTSTAVRCLQFRALCCQWPQRSTCCQWIKSQLLLTTTRFYVKPWWPNFSYFWWKVCTNSTNRTLPRKETTRNIVIKSLVPLIRNSTLKTTHMTSLGKEMVPLGKSLSRTLIRAERNWRLISAWLPLTIPVKSTWNWAARSGFYKADKRD